MTAEIDALQTILTDVDELLRVKFREIGLPDTPFVLIAIGPEDDLVLRGNLDPIGLKQLSNDLGDVADEVVGGVDDGDPIH